MPLDRSKTVLTTPPTVLVVGLLCVNVASAATYWVAPGGNDGGPGTQSMPWATLQHAADQVLAGDTVRVLAGSYAGFDLRTSGSPENWISFLAESGVEIDGDNPVTVDGINLEGASWVRIEGFKVIGRGRAGIRAVLCDHVELVGNTALDNQTWGIFTGFCDDLLIEANETAGSIEEHGIYVSNSGDRPVIRGNLIHGNHANGIHMNGDASQGGDGIISDAVVEENVIVDNGESGGSGINCDGVQNSIIRNNLIIGNHATGIALYRIDGGGPSSDNLVTHNTVVNDDDGRWGLTVSDGSTGNSVLYNIFISRHGFRGAMDVRADSLSGLISDFNVVEDRFTDDGGNNTMTLAEWQLVTGQDANSFVASEAELFVDATLPAGDYHLKAGGPAVDAAVGPTTATHDFERDPRPIGAGADIGADEWAPACLLANDHLVVADHTVSEEETRESCLTIEVGPNVEVSTSGDLTLSTRGEVRVRSQVIVAPGGKLAIDIDPATGSGE